MWEPGGGREALDLGQVPIKIGARLAKRVRGPRPISLMRPATGGYLLSAFYAYALKTAYGLRQHLYLLAV